MAERWLRTNHRLLLAEMIVPLLLLSLAAAILVFGIRQSAPGVCLAALLPAAAALLILIPIVRGLALPRLAYADRRLLVHLGKGPPIAVPIDVVECFFRGQAPAIVKPDGQTRAETATVVVRLAESAADWHHREVNRLYGQWCEGYIILRGTWCEPITEDLLRGLNRRLAEIHRQQRQEVAPDA